MGKNLMDNPRLVKKEERDTERKQRSVFVAIRQKIDKQKLRLLLPTVHPEIDHIYFPRQNRAKFAFVLCKTPESLPAVFKAIKNYKNEEVGILQGYLQPRRTKSIKTETDNSSEPIAVKSEEAEVKPDIKKAKARKGKQIKINPKSNKNAKNKKAQRRQLASPSLKLRNVIDPTKLVIDSLPKEITEEMVYKIVPSCAKITTFKTAMRPLLMEFASPDDAYKSFEIIAKTPVNGVKLTVKYHRIPAEK